MTSCLHLWVTNPFHYNGCPGQLVNPPFALVTYMKSFYKIRSEIQGKNQVNFFTKNPNLKKKSLCVCVGVGERSWERSGKGG